MGRLASLGGPKRIDFYKMCPWCGSNAQPSAPEADALSN